MNSKMPRSKTLTKSVGLTEETHSKLRAITSKGQKYDIVISQLIDYYNEKQEGMKL